MFAVEFYVVDDFTGEEGEYGEEHNLNISLDTEADAFKYKRVILDLFEGKMADGVLYGHIEYKGELA